MDLLTQEALAAQLVTVPDWAHIGESIRRQFTRDDFRGALLLVGVVAYLAETANHHPDILIEWNKVTLTLSTHSAGGLTINDFNLARAIDAVA
jgi:4a-hydroxytetrahydrobiopterin dehydratase